MIVLSPDALTDIERLRTFLGSASPGSVICPTGKNLSSPLRKNISDFPKAQISLYPLSSCPTEGRLEIVTDAGQDAVDADALTDERRLMRTAKTCGPDTPTLVSSS